MERSNNSFLSIVLGCLIGCVVSLGAALQYHWPVYFALPVGLLLGGCAVYFGCDWRGAGEAVKRAVSECPTTFQNKAKELWQKEKDTLETKRTVVICLFTLAFVISFASVVFLICFMSPDHMDDVKRVMTFTEFLGLMFCLFSFFAFLTFWVLTVERAWEEFERFDTIPWQYLGMLTFPVIVAFVLMMNYFFFTGIKALIYMHSEQRRICLTATLIGVSTGFALGYHYHNIMLGTVIGCVVGPIVGLIEFRLVQRFLPKPA